MQSSQQIEKLSMLLSIMKSERHVCGKNPGWMCGIEANDRPLFYSSRPRFCPQIHTARFARQFRENRTNAVSVARLYYIRGRMLLFEFIPVKEEFLSFYSVRGSK